MILFKKEGKYGLNFFFFFSFLLAISVWQLMSKMAGEGDLR